MLLHIKYMVSLRCILMVQETLNNLGIAYSDLELGRVEITDDLTKEQYDQLKLNLSKMKLELLDDTRHILIEKVKIIIIEMIHHADKLPIINFSEYISEKLNIDYAYISNTFSEVKGITIQQYIINHKIELAKELLIYDELSIKEIAYKLNYSSVAHLSNQFKKVTGFTPKEFKQFRRNRRTAHENL